MNCVFPLIKKAIEEGNITVDDIAKSVGEDVVIIKEKLCGKEDFIINEAMTINVELFPDIPFKTLFSHYKRLVIRYFCRIVLFVRKIGRLSVFGEAC